MGRRPNLFIIGAPKTGTTSLYTYLEGHPDVFMSPVKEPMYFCPDVRGGLRRRYEHGEDEQPYLDLFRGAGDQKYLGEASTRYLASKVAPQLIRDFEPGARIVAMVRNPVDLVHALHNERVSYGTEEITDFEEAIAADADRLAGRRLRPGADPLWAAYRNAALLGEGVGRWIDTFGREAVHVIVFDDFVADTAGAFRALLTFMGIDAVYRPASFDVRRASHRRRGGVLRRVVQNPISRWVSHRVLPAAMGRTNSSRLVWRFRQSRLNLRAAPRSSMRPETRHHLEREFGPDVARLSGLLGRDLSQLWFGRPADA